MRVSDLCGLDRIVVPHSEDTHIPCGVRDISCYYHEVDSIQLDRAIGALFSDLRVELGCEDMPGEIDCPNCGGTGCPDCIDDLEDGDCDDDDDDD